MSKPMGKPVWHPMVAEVLALLVREDGGPTIDEQLDLAGRIGALAATEQQQVTRELAIIGKRLQAAGEEAAESCVRGIAMLAHNMADAESVQRRVFARS